jgi:hypothetical protein
MTFDLSSFAVGDVVDLVIVPGRVEGLPEGADGSVFSLVFEAPTDADLVTQPAGAPITAPPATTATAPASSGTPAGSSSTPAPSSSSSSGGSGGAASRPVTPSFQPPAAPAAPALPAAEVAAPVGSPATGAVPPFEPAAADRGDARTLSVVLLIGAALATLVASRRGALLQLLGATPLEAAPAVAGLGRFARERTGEPPSLR